jgi:hypothetical protein
MIAVATTRTRIDGYCSTAYKGTAQGETSAALLRNAETLGAKAVLNTCFDDALDIETLYYGAAVVIVPMGRGAGLCDRAHGPHAFSSIGTPLTDAGKLLSGPATPAFRAQP